MYGVKICHIPWGHHHQQWKGLCHISLSNPPSSTLHVHCLRRPRVFFCSCSLQPRSAPALLAPQIQEVLRNSPAWSSMHISDQKYVELHGTHRYSQTEVLCLDHGIGPVRK